MSVYQFLASDAMLATVENDKVFLFSIKEAQERGISFPFDEKVLSRINENKEYTVLYFEKREDLAIYSMNYTKKKYCYTLNWSYAEERAEQLIDYIKRNLKKTKEMTSFSFRVDRVRHWRLHQSHIELKEV